MGIDDLVSPFHHCGQTCHDPIDRFSKQGLFEISSFGRRPVQTVLDGYLRTLQNNLCETVGILACQGKKLSRPEIVEFAQRTKGSFLLSQLYFP